MEVTTTEVFPGFWHPDLNKGFTKVPHELIDMLFRLDEAELNIVLYVMRHTWGYQEFDDPKTITIDEFMRGRKRRDGTRIDGGTGLSDRGVKDGVAKAIEHGLIICETDSSDLGRIKKSYRINIYEEN